MFDPRSVLTSHDPFMMLVLSEALANILSPVDSSPHIPGSDLTCFFLSGDKDIRLGLGVLGIGKISH